MPVVEETRRIAQVQQRDARMLIDGKWTGSARRLHRNQGGDRLRGRVALWSFRGSWRRQAPASG
jgi:hypothetical protein